MILLASDLLINTDVEEIKKRMSGRVSGRFCYWELSERPSRTGEGQKILFSDGDEVLAEAELLDVDGRELRFEPLVGVRRPTPCRVEEKWHYVDAEDCGRYEIEFMGTVHEYKTLNKLIRAILEKRKGARDSLDVLCHTIWTEVQDLDLNTWYGFEQRLSRGDIRTVKREIQVVDCYYPPTRVKQLRKLYSKSNKAHRYYEGFQIFFESVKSFYKKQGDSKVVDQLDDVEFKKIGEESGLSPREQAILRSKVVDRDLGFNLG